MNPVTDHPPPLPLQPPRSSFSCNRHPEDKLAGFCSSCLCERLTILDQPATASSSSRRNPTSSSTTTAMKSICRIPLSKATAESPPELRRTKSFSVWKNKELRFVPSVLELQRKSCDVRDSNNLCSRFSMEERNQSGHQTSGSTGAALETNKEDNINNLEDDEVRVSEEEEIRDLNDLENDIVEMEAKIDAIVGNLSSIKDQIDRDVHSKKPSISKFWSAASVWNKKWQKWRRKQKKSVVDRNNAVPTRTLPATKTISGPRFSLDAAGEARGSWDGYVIGRSFPKLPPMVGAVEEAGGFTQRHEFGSWRSTIEGIQTVTNGRVCGRLKFHSIGGEKELERYSNSARWWNWNAINRQTANHSVELRKGLNRSCSSAENDKKAAF